MRFHFCTNDKWYSKAAAFIGREPHTHIGLEFFPYTMDLVIDCTKPHSKLYHMSHWRNKYNILNTLELKVELDIESCFYENTVLYCINEPYDWKTYYYLWFLGIRRFIFGTPFPKRNEYNGDGLICTEIMDAIKYPLDYYLDIDLCKYDFSIVTPTQIYNLLKEYPNIEEIPNADKKSENME